MADIEPTTRAPRAREAWSRDPEGLPRRSMLKGLAVAGVAFPFLAACGSGSDSGGDPSGGDPSQDSSGDSSSDSSGDGSEIITPVSDVKVGGGVILPDKGIVVTQPSKGTFEGFSSTCTHQGCTVASISGGKITCPCHGSQYSIKDGSVVRGPAPLPLPKKPVKVEGSNVVSA
jgi:Rieske Fe-S protein